MHEWQLAGLAWRMNHRTDADQRHADETVGRLMAGLTRRPTWVRGLRRPRW